MSLVLGEDKAQRIWKNYFKDAYNTDTQVQVAFHMSGLMGFREAIISYESWL